MKTKIQLITAALGLALLGSGCSAPQNVDGTAVDGYLSGATVCLDTNGNLTCDLDEAQTVTDANGKFTLNIADADGNDNARIICRGGIDTASGAAFSGIMISPVSKGADGYMVSPMTSMVAKLCASNSDADVEAAQKTVAAALGLSSSDFADLARDPVALAGRDATKRSVYEAALELQKSIEIMVKAQAKATGESEESAMSKVMAAYATQMKNPPSAATSAATMTDRMSAFMDAVAADSSLNATYMSQAATAAKALASATKYNFDAMSSWSSSDYAAKQRIVEGYKDAILAAIAAGTFTNATISYNSTTGAVSVN